MPDYRRNRVPGGTFFFTVNPLDRCSDLLVTRIDALRDPIRRVRSCTPSHIGAWAVLPDHMHYLWTLPEGDANFPGRWHAIKIAFSKILAHRRTTITGHEQPWRTRHLAAPVLGIYDPRRAGLCHPHGLHALQPGQAWSGGAPGGSAALVFSSMCGRRGLSGEMDGRQREPQQTGRAAVRKPEARTAPPGMVRGGMRYAFLPYTCWSTRMQNSPHSPSHPIILPLTAQRVFTSWSFDFDFLMWKARQELEFSMKATNNKLFLAHALNLSVTIHAIADHLWYSGAEETGRWAKFETFVQWIKTQKPYADCIGIFIDISNTYKHSERRDVNRFIDYIEMQTFPEAWVMSRSPAELRNRIVDDAGGSLWPILIAPDSRPIHYRYAAEAALFWWQQNHAWLVSGTSAANATP